MGHTAGCEALLGSPSPRRTGCAVTDKRAVMMNPSQRRDEDVETGEPLPAHSSLPSCAACEPTAQRPQPVADALPAKRPAGQRAHRVIPARSANEPAAQSTAGDTRTPIRRNKETARP